MRKPPVSPKQLQASCWEQQPISHIWNSRLARVHLCTGHRVPADRKRDEHIWLCPVGSGQERR